MKKFLALALAIVMMAAIAVPAFAAEFEGNVAPEVEDFTEETLWEETRYGDGNDDSAQQNYLTDANDSEEENTRIEYGVAQAYTVTIPADVRLYEYVGSDETNQTKGYVYGIEELSVSDVVVAGDEELNIYVSSTQYNKNNDNKWTMVDTETGANNVADGDGPSDDVNYKIVAADVTYEADGVTPIAAPQNYMTKTEYGTVTGVVSSDDRTVDGEGKATARDGLILTCLKAAGNAGTTGSEKTINLYFSSMGTAQEGTYRDVLTFTVRVQKTIADATTGA